MAERVTVRYWAAAKDAAGVAEETFDGPFDSFGHLLQSVRAAHKAGEKDLPRVLLRCSFLVDGQPVGTRPHDAVPLADGSVVEVLPPFAGG